MHVGDKPDVLSKIEQYEAARGAKMPMAGLLDVDTHKRLSASLPLLFHVWPTRWPNSSTAIVGKADNRQQVGHLLAPYATVRRLENDSALGSNHTESECPSSLKRSS